MIEAGGRRRPPGLAAAGHAGLVPFAAAFGGFWLYEHRVVGTALPRQAAWTCAAA